jgi:hypothetical protein
MFSRMGTFNGEADTTVSHLSTEMKKSVTGIFAFMGGLIAAVGVGVFWSPRSAVTPRPADATIAIRKGVNGHILIRAVVSGRPVLLMVDTGAARALYLDAAFVREAGLATGVRSDMTYGVGGVGLAATEVDPVEVCIGGSTMKLSAQSLDLFGAAESWDSGERPAGILGAEFLSGNRVVIDYATMRMRMDSEKVS